MQILVNGKQCISLILVAAYYSQRKRKEKARKAKHAEAGVEISNHECKYSVASVCCPQHMQPMHSSCAVTKIHSRLLQNLNVHILMLWIWSIANIKNWDFECIYKAARWFTGLTKALRVSRTLQEVPIKHKYCTDSNALECHHAKILEYSAYRSFRLYDMG